MVGPVREPFDAAVNDEGELCIPFAVQRTPYGYKNGEWAFPETENFRDIAVLPKSSTLTPVEFMQRVQEIILADLDKIADGDLNQFAAPEDIYLVSYTVTTRHNWQDTDQHCAIIQVEKPSKTKGDTHRRCEIAADAERQLLEMPMDDNTDLEEFEHNSLIQAYVDFFKPLPPERAAELGLRYDLNPFN